MSDDIEVIKLKVLRKRYVEVTYIEGGVEKNVVVTGKDIVNWWKVEMLDIRKSLGVPEGPPPRVA